MEKISSIGLDVSASKPDLNAAVKIVDGVGGAEQITKRISAAGATAKSHAAAAA